MAAKTKKNKNKNGGGSGFASGGGFGGSGGFSSNSKVRKVSSNAGGGEKALRNAANTFDKLTKAFGKNSVSDVYVRSPLNDEQTFWFVGKTARVIDNDEGRAQDAEKVELRGGSYPTPNEAALSQKRLILEYAKSELRPQNFG